MMTLDEAIKHAEEVAEEKESEVQDLEYSKLDWRYEANQCSKCVKEHRQLAEWLKDYKRLLEQEPKIGYWKTVPYEDTLFCSHCNLRLDDEQTYIPLHFCPNCGYKMESEKEYEQRKIHK